MKDLKLLGSDGTFFGINNDVVISNHDIVLVDSTEKISQDLIKILSTVRGSHPLFISYGSALGNIINQRNTEKFRSDLKREIIYAVEWIQKMNINETINIDSIDSVNIEEGPNYYNIVLTVKLNNGKPLTVNYKK